MTTCPSTMEQGEKKEKRRGRPCLLDDPTFVTDFLNGIRLTGKVNVAADYAGVARGTVFGYLAKGREAKRGKYRDFYDAFTRTRGEAAMRRHMRIEKAAMVDWRADAWWLERTFPEEYGKAAEITPDSGAADALKEIGEIVKGLSGRTIDAEFNVVDPETGEEKPSELPP